MKKLVTVLLVGIYLLLVGCSSEIRPILAGGYQSEIDDGYIVQLGVQPDDQTFSLYIDNREVDRGTYEMKSEGSYLLISADREFDINLTKENSVEIVINQLNNKEPIELKNSSKTPIYFTTEFDDLKEYEKLLD
ncbi:hypothetical protein [Carnobacterium sp. TMP28]|uniref:hypothetical protein n=1 Tax=Carnobacterium sp. TMP28 TaxID=3397060 RepID=UPI0039DF59FF